jgi:hypothetical protein
MTRFARDNGVAKAAPSKKQDHLKDKSSTRKSLLAPPAAFFPRLVSMVEIRPEGIMSATKTIGPAMQGGTATRDAGKPLLRCPITGHPCEGDLSHLCDDYGCARKGGLSPHSAENF